MKKRLLAFAVTVIFCISIFGIGAAAADAPSMIGTLANGKLTVSVTGLSSDVAQVNFLAINAADQTDYRINTATVTGDTALVTFTVKGTDYKISATAVTSSLSEITLTPIEVKISAGVTYASHVQNVGWQSFVSDGSLSGTTGRALRDEAIKINLTGNVPDGASITYQAHVQGKGWMKPVSNGTVAGITGQSLRLEALRITLSGLSGYEVKYRVHVQNKGWLPWQTTGNGADISKAGIAGTTGKGLRMEAVEIEIAKAS